MKTAILAISTISMLALAPGWALARDVTGQLTQTQVDHYCASPSGAKGQMTFDLGHGKSVTGTVDCPASKTPALTAASGADDNGMESANDADSSHED
jgi:hypothetical protein